MKKGSSVASGAQSRSSALVKDAKVNATVARDLVSNAGSSRIADMADFIAGANGMAPQLSPEAFEHGKTLLNNRSGLDNQSRQVEEDLRSMRSEFDYGSKKKFVDVLGNVSQAAQLKRLRAQHEMELASGAAFSIKGSNASKASGAKAASIRSQMTKNSKNSQMSKQSKVKIERVTGMKEAVANAITEELEEVDDELEAQPEDFINCNTCMR